MAFPKNAIKFQFMSSDGDSFELFSQEEALEEAESGFGLPYVIHSYVLYARTSPSAPSDVAIYRS